MKLPPLSAVALALAALSGFAAAASAAVTRVKPAGDTVTYSDVNDALAQAEPGDLVLLDGGVYKKNLLFTRSGLPGAPIHLTRNPASTSPVVIDGSDYNIASLWQQDAQGRWFADAVYFGEDPAAPTATPYAIASWVSVGNYDAGAEAVLLPAYASLAAFDQAVRGPGSFRTRSSVYPNDRTKTRLYLRLPPVGSDANPDPRGWTINVGKAVGVINTNNQSHWKISDLEIRHGGWAGVYLKGSAFTDVELDGVVVRNSFRGISTDEVSGTKVRISNCSVLNGYPRAWAWSGAYTPGVGADPLGEGLEETAPWRGVGVKLNASGGSDAEPSLLSSCLVRGQWDGFQIEGAYIRARHNTIHAIQDDAVELESSVSRYLHFNNNLIYDTFVGISVSSNRPGPIYVYRNVVEAWRIQNNAHGYCVKSGVDWASDCRNVKFYHNTFTAKKLNVWEKFDDAAPEKWLGYDFYNNLFYAWDQNYNFRGYDAGASGSANVWTGNVYNHPCGDWREAGLHILDGSLASSFVLMRTDRVGSTHTGEVPLPSDLRLKPVATHLLGTARPLPADWPDSVSLATGRDPGAWEDGAADMSVGRAM